MHSINTLSYAAPFKTSPPKPRGPAPYDAADPRTWDHAQTHAWLTKQFDERAKARRQAAWNVKAKEAAIRGKKLRLLDPSDLEGLPLPVDVDKLCPPGLTAKNFGSMYTMEFVGKCLEAKPAGEDVYRFEGDFVKNSSVEVIGQLFYLILSAKTRTRNAIMKSRKKLTEADTYGKQNHDTFQFLLMFTVGESPHKDDYVDIHHGDELEARIFIGLDKWNDNVHSAIAEARKNGSNIYEARDRATKIMLDAWEEEKHRRADSEGPQNE